MMNSSGTYSSGMAQQEVVWLRIRGWDGERQLKKKVRMPLRQLVSMNLRQFHLFLEEKLELSHPLPILYGDDEGDKIPVTSDDELNVMVYMAELLARQGRALDLRLRDRAAPPAPEDRSLTSARQLARRAERQVAARVEEMQRRSERRRCELHPHRESVRRREERSERPRPTEVRPVPAQPADPLWTRVDLWQRRCVAGGGGETPEDGWRRAEREPQPALVEQPSRSRSQPPPQDTARAQAQDAARTPAQDTARAQAQDTTRTPPQEASGGKGNGCDSPPEWFAAFMGQFQRDLMSEVVRAVKAELAAAPCCLCTVTRAADTNSAPKRNDRPNESPHNVTNQEPTTPQTAVVVEPSWVATFPDPALAPAPAPEVGTSDAGVQTTASVPPPPSGSPTWRPWGPELAAGVAGDGAPGDDVDGGAPRAAGTAPVDEVGLFSVSEPATADTTLAARSSPVSGVSSGSGRSVSGVHTGVTVYSSGGGSVETTASTAGRPQLLREVHSEPAGRPRPRPRRQLTGVEEADYSCVLVMTERLATELEPLMGAGVDGATGAGAGEGGVDDVLASAEEPGLDGAVSVPLETLAVAPAVSDAAPPSAGPEQESVQERKEPVQERQESVQERQESVQGRQESVLDQEPPVSEAQWQASEPPMPPPPPPAQPVDAPELETAVKKLATEPDREPLEPEPEPEEPELEEGFVTVNGRRLSLSEDDFSDIVIISSPGGSERFELLEQMTEEEGEMTSQPGEAQLNQPTAPQASPDAAGEPMVCSALSDRWVDAPTSMEDSGSTVSGWAASSAGSELLRSTCESAPAACHIDIASPAALPDRVISLPAGVRLNTASAAPHQPAIPEGAGQESAASQESQESGAVSLMEPLCRLPALLRFRLLERLQLMPEMRQKQLASDMTGRRSVEPFWDRLGVSAASAGTSRMEALLRDQAARPAGVGLLADSLDGMLRHIKVSASSSSQVDGMGAQSVKHALCVLREAVRSEETSEEETVNWTPPRLQTPGQERQETARQESQESARQESQEGTYQEQPSLQDQSCDRPGSAERFSGPESAPGVPSWLAGLAGLLPDGVMNVLRHSHRRDDRDAVPSEAEALMISRLVEMGFYDVDRIRALYREFGDDCNVIALHLLDSEL